MKPRSTLRTFLLACSTLLTASSLHATSLTWDPAGGGTSDGAGTWLNTGVWWDGAANVDWSNATPDNAVIGNGGAGGTITLGAVTAGTVLIENFSGTYRLDGTSLNQSGGITVNTDDASDRVELDTPISGAGGVTMNGPGYLRFENSVNQLYTGTTTLNGGVTMMGYVGSTTLAPGNLTMNGGVLEAYWGETFSRTLGTGAGEVQILGGASGFSQNGNNGLTVQINNSAAYEVVWGSTYFNPSTLVLQSEYAQPNSSLNFKNKIDLNGAPRTIEVAKTSVGSGYAQIENVIRNSDVVNPSGLNKTGPGVLRLTNTGNSYDGPTVVTDGVLQLGTSWSNANAIPGGIGAAVSGSNLEINGGNVRLAYYLRRTLGSGDGQLQITGGTSGFSHTQADTYGRISINNDNNFEVVWGSAFFQPDVLVLNEENALPDQVVNFQNKLDLNGADRTVATNSTRAVSGAYINSNQGFMTTTGGRITGDIRNSSGTAAGLIKTGPGHLQLTGTNTYDGGTTINEGQLEFTKITAMPASGTVTVNDGTTLTVAVGGGGEWTTGTSGNGTVGGLLAGLGGQAGSTVTYVGTSNLGLNVSGSQTYAGVISSAGNVAVLGSGSLELTGDNTFSGEVIVDGGATLILSGDNSGATGSIRIINGYLQADVANLPTGGVTYDSPANDPAILLGSGAFGPTLGSAGDVFFNNNGGFAATSSAFTVTPNAGATIDWSANGGFNGKKLMLGSPNSTASVEIPNDIDLDGDRTIRLFNNSGSSADVSILSGDIIESGGRHLYVEGNGTLVLTGTNAFGTGNRRLQIGSGTVVRAVDTVGLPSTAVLFFAGGVLESSGSITRDISNVSGNAYWNNQGGFAANGGALTVNLQSGAALDWNATTGGFRGQNPLYLGSDTADNVVTLQNDILLNNNRNINVPDNPDTDTDYAVVSGVISNGSGSRNLQKDNDGTLVLEGDNSYTGTTTINGGTLIINGDQTSATGLVDVKANGKFLGGTGTHGGNVTLENNSGLTFDLSTPAGSHDKLDVLGSFTFESASVLTITSSGGASTGTYTLVTAGSAPSGSVPATVNLPIDWTADAPQIVGNDLVINITSTGAASSPYDDWAAGTFTNPFTLTDPTDNPDGDAFNNLLEFAFGTDPTVSDISDLDMVALTNGRPIVNVDWTGGLSFDAVFVRRKDYGTSGSVSYTVQFSGDLVNFVSSAVVPTVIGDSSEDPTNYEIVSVPYPFFITSGPGAGQKARFFRLSVDEVP